MRAVVFSGWVPFTGKLEGVVPWMYLDILGLITVAIGNLADPIDAALGLPFVHPDGSPASRHDIAAEWRTLKTFDCGTRNGAANCPWRRSGKVCCAHQGHLAARAIAKLRLTPEGVSRVVLGKLAANHAALVQRFPDIEDWCGDAQFFVHSMAWACGSGFRFPRLEAALRAQDFAEALAHCHIDESGPDRINGTADDNWGLKPRNAANKALLANAVKVQGYHLDPDVLLFEIPGGPLVTPPANHVPPRQDVSLLWEENTGSGGILHVMPDWPSYRE